MSGLRNLVVVLGDQLDDDSAAFDGFDTERDRVWMAEVDDESTHVWTHKQRIALFLSAMRHFRDRLRKGGRTVDYTELGDDREATSLGAVLEQSVRAARPQRVIVVEPGEWRVRRLLERTAKDLGVELEVRTDRHFLCTAEQFAEHADGRKQLRLEYFYREMRRRHEVLMDGDQPAGGRWNFDSENRDSFDADGPGDELSAPRSFAPDATTTEVLELVDRRFAEHPGSSAHFDWPVTRKQARAALRDFVEHRLGRFGRYQDAIWVGEPFLYHSRLAAALNLKLIDPRTVVDEVSTAWRDAGAPLAAVEGFVRQILGWREYVRGIYWRFMPEYLERNALDADLELPSFYWSGETEMACLRDAIGQTLERGYAHHIQRLMVTGLFALLLGVAPRRVHEWYLAVYVDAVEWVELPNVLGMSQFADGGIMASKPYVATGKYIDRMSNACRDCRFRPDRAAGDDACPFTTLYWDFLARHRSRLEEQPRMRMQLRNLERKQSREVRSIRKQADEIRSQA